MVPLRPLSKGKKKDVLQILEDSLAYPRLREVPSASTDKLKVHTAKDVDDLLPHLERRATEPERIQQTYQVRAERIEPVGIVYLYPVSN